MTLILLFLATVFCYSLISRRLESSVLTAPIVFASVGMLIPCVLPEMSELSLNRKLFLGIAEVGLAMLLFTDASRTELKVLRSINNLPVRLLSIGMLLTICLGAIFALSLFETLSIWEAGILAAILAPTDAGLGQIIVNSERVPLRIRQALNVEAGLNDGMAVPFLMCFIALSRLDSGGGASILVNFLWEQLGLGVLIGGGIGLAGGLLLGIAHRRQWMGELFEQLAVVTLPLFCILACEIFEASMFIAAFVAGLVVQLGFKEAGRHSVEFTESWGQVLNFFVFYLFGLLITQRWGQFSSEILLYALLSLTIVRMLPVAVSLIGTRLSAGTLLFMGWFGPRGLASIVLGLVYLEEEAHLAGESIIRLAVMLTVLLSIFLHGASAMAGIGLYARKISNLPSNAPEIRAV